MFTRKVYYFLKPALPYPLRIWFRRMRARRLLEAHTGEWPILERAARRPAGFPGWPEGRQFAVVLTHDVEGTVGLDRCLELADLEKRLGFRSSFNFVPEGEYRVPDSMRAKLVADGFEVGVHGLYHDGKLFNSEEEFNRRAVRINEYIRQWNASGFRAPFMHHNLDWFHKLDVEYDASTFDTDPFEPQPDGVGTIFPFKVPGPAGRPGYVELPYTLPQDFTLFTILHQTTPRIWIEKLDWVASKGGMVLVNVHPDYVRFGGAACDPGEFPVSHYTALLEHLQTKHVGRYWHALPRDVARYAAGWKS